MSKKETIKLAKDILQIAAKDTLTDGDRHEIIRLAEELIQDAQKPSGGPSAFIV